MTEKTKKRSPVGLLAVSITGAAAIGLTIAAIPFVTPALRRHCLPYVPATSTQVNNVIGLIRRSLPAARSSPPHNPPSLLHSVDGRAVSEHRVVDLGSGDGRIVIAAANHGFLATGVELNYWLVLYARLAAWRQGLRSRCQFKRADLWNFDLSSFDVIVVFGVAEIMPILRSKMSQEMKADCKIVVCRFPITDCTPIDTLGEGIDAVWMYDKSSVL